MLLFAEEKGKGLERELAEGGGSGESRFVVCDVLCEADMKVRLDFSSRMVSFLDLELISYGFLELLHFSIASAMKLLTLKSNANAANPGI